MDEISSMRGKWKRWASSTRAWGGERSNASGASMNIIQVAAGLVFREGRLLITQRPPGGHLAGLWEFPGGKREADESFEDCLRRELREELGVEVDVGELVESITHEYPGKSVHLQF